MASEAVVLCWNEEQFCVGCPFCGQDEVKHFYSPDRSSVGIYKNRRYFARCRRGSYVCMFPFDEDGNITGYEIDVLRECFINIRIEDVPDVDLRQALVPIDELALALKRSTIAGSFGQVGSREKSQMITQQESLTILLRTTSLSIDTIKQSENLLGRLQKIPSLDQCHFVEDHAERETQLNECLKSAMCSGRFDDIKLVLQSGADIHHVSGGNFRTPLMNAAFWGGLEMVEIFLKHGKEVSSQVQRESCLNRCLIDAASLGTLEVVQRLLDELAILKDDQPTTRRQRTALMEACLWGRLDVVKLLLEHGASAKASDSDYHQAVDFARPNQRNKLERNKRTVGSDSISVHLHSYQQDLHKKDETRKAIVRLFEDCPPTESYIAGCLFIHDPKNYNITLQEPPDILTEFVLLYGQNYKTVAKLKRGPQFQSIASMSGWGNNKGLPRWAGREYLNPTNPISEVFRYARLIGHTIARHKNDQDTPGQYNASHAEKQLIAEFLNRHVLMSRAESIRQLQSLESTRKMLEQLELDNETVLRTHYAFRTILNRFISLTHQAPISSSLDSPGLVGDNLSSTDQSYKNLRRNAQQVVGSDMEFITAVKTRLTHIKNELQSIQESITQISQQKSLAEIMPPVSLKDPVILVSSPMCEDCKQFLEAVNEFYHLQIRVDGAIAEKKLNATSDN